VLTSEQPESARHALLLVEGLTVFRGGKAVVENVSFVAAPGDLVALVGPNGAGKSSLFAALLGLVPRADGRVSLAGSFAYVPQGEPSQQPFPVTALDVALMGAYRRAPFWRPLGRSEKAKALSALDRVGLRELARSPFGRLSGGQRQRVMLARALVQESTVLLLDEPLSGVDAVSEAVILATLAEERAGGRAILLATHDLALARARCTHALLLNRVAFGFGPPGAVLTAETLRAAYGPRLVVFDELGLVGAIDEGSHHTHSH
jgi:ABC-type Mn2+/Zn2+ transport system ATPase subunit